MPPRGDGSHPELSAERWEPHDREYPKAGTQLLHGSRQRQQAGRLQNRGILNLALRWTEGGFRYRPGAVQRKSTTEGRARCVHVGNGNGKAAAPAWPAKFGAAT